jgi:hypothetical protein
MTGWVNGDEYEGSNESFGILPLSETARTHLGMLVYHPDFAKEKHIHHSYLAQHQQTRVAVLPVHTAQERALFRLLVKSENGLFSGRKEPNWVTVTVEWSRYCDGVEIFYKVCPALLHVVSWVTGTTASRASQNILQKLVRRPQ